VSVSTHVLDTGRGRPAAGVPVRLDRHAGEAVGAAGTGDGGGRDGSWLPVADGVTDADGRLRDWATTTPAGLYRLVFDTAACSDFFPQVCVTFTITDAEEHHHVPLLLSPFAYSTYRGS
jgi:5-hydroxyisourate hydrolase